MSKKIQWEVGKVYLTKGGLCAQIINIVKQAVPKDLTDKERRYLTKKPFYGLEGYVFIADRPTERVRGSWTMSGKHTWENPANDSGDLTLTPANFNQ